LPQRREERKDKKGQEKEIKLQTDMNQKKIPVFTFKCLSLRPLRLCGENSYSL
jgi:hypothetical protein